MHIPCVVLFELAYLIEKKRVTVDINQILVMLKRAVNYKVEPICIPVIEKSVAVLRARVPDPWDRLIVGTAIYLGLPLITRDRSLQDLTLNINTVW